MEDNDEQSLNDDRALLHGLSGINNVRNPWNELLPVTAEETLTIIIVADHDPASSELLVALAELAKQTSLLIDRDVDVSSDAWMDIDATIANLPGGRR